MTKETVLKSPLSNNTLQVFKLTNDSNNIFNKSLVVSDETFINIPIREDGYINATALCKAGGKQWSNYFQNEQTKRFMKALIFNLGIPRLKIIESKKGGICKNQGTWVHRKVAIHLAQWISPEFSLQVSNWIDELLITGSVTLGKEKSQEEIEQKYQETIEKLQNESQEKDNKIKLMTDENI